MDKIIFYPTIVIAIVFIYFYWTNCKKAQVEFNNAKIVTLILQSSGIICGLLLLLGSMSETVKSLINDLDLYIFISGATVIGASLKGLLNEIRVNQHNNADTDINNKN